MNILFLGIFWLFDRCLSECLDALRYAAAQEGLADTQKGY